ncbi:MAG TPA: hypothetical protein DCW86_01560 [Actinobacteria bacterium]|nr:hypothetical protein [Actinomycetota bacterium]
MKTLSTIALIVAVVSLIGSLVVKFIIGAPVFNISPSAFLRFTDTSLLFAIAFLLMTIAQKK